MTPELRTQVHGYIVNKVTRGSVFNIDLDPVSDLRILLHLTLSKPFYKEALIPAVLPAYALQEPTIILVGCPR